MKKITKIMIFSVIIITFIGIITAIRISGRLPKNPEGTIGNTPTNLMNGGRFAENNGYVYFSNPADNNRLYRMTTEGKEITRLSDDCVSHINVCDNFIFYIRNNFSPSVAGSVFHGQMYGIVRSSLDGKKTTTLSSDIVKSLLLYDNSLIYLSYKKPNIYTSYMSIDKSEQGTYTNIEIPIYSYCDGQVFYSGSNKEHGIFSFDLNTCSSGLVLAGNTYKACKIDNNLYYIDLADRYTLTKYDTLTGTSLKLADHVINYNVYDNTIFYQVEDGNHHAIYRMRADGSEQSFIMDGDYDSISCTSNYTYITKYNQPQIYRTPTNDVGLVEYMLYTEE